MAFLFGRKQVIPPPSGEHAVGTRRFDVKNAAAARTVCVQAWYPAQRGDGPTEPYLDDVVRAALAEFTRVPKFLLPQNPSYSHPNAARVAGRFPVLLFNHGFGSFQKQSTSLMEELASHGFVVLSVGHPSESLVVQFADGTSQGRRADHPAWVEITAGLENLEKNVRELEPLFDRARAAKDPGRLREVMNAIAAHRSYAVLAPLVTAWRQDTATVLDQLDASPLAEQVDASRVGVFGHSLGGMVAGQLAMNDPRVRAGMSYDGAQLPFPGDGPSALPVPFCFVYADASKVGAATARSEGINDGFLGPGGCGVVIRGASHLNFTDMNNLSMMARALGPIDRVEMAKVLRAMTVGFFDHHLKGKPLSGFTPSPAFEFTTRRAG
ncbi:MAG: dienelactone hydrolase family protein [Myxococcaceae bacterium]|nr:dienelactone hydrolase family protein [Myxococcaceae bacterium]